MVRIDCEDAQNVRENEHYNLNAIDFGIKLVQGWYKISPKFRKTKNTHVPVGISVGRTLGLLN